jgi:hypothetical protein
MKRIIAATLVLALITPALPALAADSTAETTGTSYSVRQPAHPASSLRESAKQAVSTETAYGPRSLPRQGSEGVRNQMGGGGGGKAGMIIGLVSAAAGIGLTVYMLKYMKKSTDAASKTN